MICSKYKKVNLYFQDESRFGLKTHIKKVLTAKNVKPICPYQHKFKSTYIYGSYSPIDGKQFNLILPYVSGDWFELYLKEFAKQDEDEFKILVCDNAPFHKNQSIEIPDNMALLFIPPYSPELNPSEKIWDYLKDDFANKIFDTMDKLETYLCDLIQNKLNTQSVLSIVRRSDFINAFHRNFELKT